MSRTRTRTHAHCTYQRAALSHGDGLLLLASSPPSSLLLPLPAPLVSLRPPDDDASARALLAVGMSVRASIYITFGGGLVQPA